MEREKVGRREWDMVTAEKLFKLQDFAAKKEFTLRNIREGVVEYSTVVIWTSEGFPEGAQARDDVAELVHKVYFQPHDIEAAKRAVRRLRMHTVEAPENASPLLRGLTGERAERVKAFYNGMVILATLPVK